MKKILFLAIAGLTLCTSCKSDDEENNGNDEMNMLVGVWKTSKQITVSGVDNTTVLDTYVPTGCYVQDYVNFKTDGTYVVTEYKSENNSCVVDSSEAGTYTYNPQTKELSISSSGTSGSDIIKVQALTNSSLVISVNDDFDGDGIKDKMTTYLYR